MGLRGSEITLYGETQPPPSMDKSDRIYSRTKVKTNGHFTTFMQVDIIIMMYKSFKIN